MKQEIYVNEEILKYNDLSLCCSKDFENKFYTNNYSLIDNEEYFRAEFKSLHEHDKELVAKIQNKLDKIHDWKKLNTWVKTNIDKLPLSDIDKLSIKTLTQVVDQIQKEYEK